jgi:NADPH:quinone reductase
MLPQAAYGWQEERRRRQNVVGRWWRVVCGSLVASRVLPTTIDERPTTLSRVVYSFAFIEAIMKAIQIKQTGGPEVMEMADLPVPQPKPNEAVVKITAAGVNFIDVYNREGRYKVPLPFVLGQEGAGVVSAIGPEVREVAVGDRVAYTSVLGSYAEYAAVPADRLVKVPAEVGDREAAAAMLQGMTAHYLSHDTFPLKKGETALIHAAAGGVGLLLVQMAHNIGARIIATVSTDAKAKLARDAGADEIILYTQSDFEAETKRLTGGKGVDVVYDSVGKTTFEKGLNLLRPRGMMVLFGGSSGAVPPFDPITLTQKGSIYLTRPSLGHYIITSQELRQRASAVFGMIREGKLKLRIEHIYPLAQAAHAHRDLEGRKTTGKLLLIPN